MKSSQDRPLKQHTDETEKNEAFLDFYCAEEKVTAAGCLTTKKKFYHADLCLGMKSSRAAALMPDASTDEPEHRPWKYSAGNKQ
jgi:hypothetical protein